MGKALDLTGKKFGRLTVLREADRGARRLRRWLCMCDCGNEHTTYQFHLTARDTKSCGCVITNSVQDSGFRGLLQRYKAGAKLRNISWDLTEEQFSKLTSSPCYYTGREPSNVFISSNAHLRRRNKDLPPNPGNTYTYNGIDRLNSNLGYTSDNCVSCCKDANLAKQSLSHDEFIALCKEIAARH